MKRPLFLFFVLLFALLVFESIIYGEFFFVDEVRNLKDSLNLISGKLDFYYFHRPLSILLLSPFLMITKKLIFSRFYGILISLISAFVFYKILNLFLSDKQSFYGTLLFSTFPVFLGIAPTLLTDHLSILFSLLGLYSYFVFNRDGKSKHLYASSIILSLGFLAKEMVIFTAFVILLDLLLKKKFRELFSFGIVFSILPAIYFISFWLLTGKLAWLDFYLMNAGRFKWSALFSGQYLLLILVYGNITFLWGLYSIIKHFNKKNNIDLIFLINLILNISIFILWPDVKNRHFVFFLPSLVYFISKYQLPLVFKKRIFSISFWLLILFNILLSICFLNVLLTPYLPSMNSVNWVISNASGETVFSNNYLVNFLLDYNYVSTTHDISKSTIVVYDSTFSEVDVSGHEPIKEFSGSCALSFIRTMKCDSVEVMVMRPKSL